MLKTSAWILFLALATADGLRTARLSGVPGGPAPISVRITYPPDGAAFVAGMSILVQAAVEYEEDAIDRVIFFANTNTKIRL